MARQTLDRLTDGLLAARTADGHWEGRLSSSALSTATAVIALALVDRHRPRAGLGALARRGVAWLLGTQNEDGGWGDTTDSPSNVSTTALCWAALTIAGTDHPPCVAALEQVRLFMRRAAGSLAPRPLADTISRRYGKDRTFSAPILTVLALAGLLSADQGGADERNAGERGGDEPRAGRNGGIGRDVQTAVDLSKNGKSGGGDAGAASRAPLPAAAAERTPAGDGQTTGGGQRIGRCGRPDRWRPDGDGQTTGGGQRIGSGWRHVPQLPFELAAVPPACYRWLRLPVVSYALPALIAIGQARHRQRPTRNPVTRLLRRAARLPALRRLKAIQPRGGGFLEATPLTSFVVMSLVAAGEAGHPVVDRGVAFLERSARKDGSWPIDTNLATWVTTLSVNALARRTDWPDRLAPVDRAALSRWLLDQQYRDRHVYTDADPGGWAWTDLPGGVPDADDTPGALLALHALGADDATHREAARAGIRWLLDLQNADGGIPTFCRGWGALPFDRSSPDLTAHTLRAWTVWRPALPDPLRIRTERAITRAVRFLEQAQRPDGSWIPLWFGNQHAPDEANPVFGTARVLEGLAALSDGEASPAAEQRAARWLVDAQGNDGGWGGAAGVSSSIEETALAVSALATFGRLPRAATVHGIDEALTRSASWLSDATDGGRCARATPIGLYFAKLWYSEKLYPWAFALGALAAVESADLRYDE